jgi:hypothetical protein
LVTFVVVTWASSGPLPEGKTRGQPGGPSGQGEKPVEDAPRRGADPTKDKAESFFPQLARVRRIDKVTRLEHPLPIPEARVNIIEKQEISMVLERSTRTLLFLGTEVDIKTLSQEQIKKLQAEEKLITERLPFLAIEATEQDRARGVPVFTIRNDQRLFRRFDEEDQPEPNRMRMVLEEKNFLRLHRGSPVKKNQLLGLLDPAIARQEAAIKIAKLDSSYAELQATIKTKEEAKNRYDAAIRANARTPGTVSAEDVRGHLLNYQRYSQEEIQKRENVNVARNELRQVNVTLKLHEIRAAKDGVVKDIYKSSGDAVKEQDQILLIQNPKLLQVEGFVDVQDARNLALGMPVVVEPSQPEAPAERLSGHREAVTAVAVSKGLRPVVVSASEDRTARVWNVIPVKNPRTGKMSWAGEAIYTLEHPAAVRSVACTPPGSARNLCLTGTSDGVGRLWDLDNLDKAEPRSLAQTHRGAINTVAFSPTAAAAPPARRTATSACGTRRPASCWTARPGTRGR